ncbi:MAG TPA: hypothetical protein VFC26_01760 [Verrucomicrobiae bacterium]|nr:hypothetical protein [Verrucomicrobiae bacterium]
MKYLTFVLLVIMITGCQHKHEGHEPPEGEISLYDEHDGLSLPEEMQRELGVELAAVSDTNAIPESAIIRGAREDFTYVKDGKHFVRTPLGELVAGAQIVTRGVKDLWMIELLAIRGGEPCCH